MDRPGEKKDEIKKSFKRHPATLAGNAFLRAARGDDGVMSQPPQQQQRMPGVFEVNGKWKQDVGLFYDKISRGKLTGDELLKSEGHAQKQTSLVQERYAISRDEADKQVNNFIEKHRA